MDWVETTGKTIEEAQEAALDVLGVEFGEAQFEILEEPKAGFLGMNRRDARVRARVRPSTPKPKDSRRPRKRRAGERSEADNGEVAVERPPRRKQSDARKSPKKEVAMVDNVPSQGDGDGVSTEELQEETQVSRTDLAVAAQHFLADLLHELDLSGTVTVDSLDEESMELSVNGDNLGALIGTRGAVIAAVQELTRAVVQGQGGDNVGRVTVDVSGYRQRRREALLRFTESVVEEVRTSGEERAFEPMIAAERKIVHDAVAEASGVGSRSEGEEPDRFVVVFPRSDSSAV
jgi:spoIIIJ-associated protein